MTLPLLMIGQTLIFHFLLKGRLYYNVVLTIHTVSMRCGGRSCKTVTSYETWGVTKLAFGNYNQHVATLISKVSKLSGVIMTAFYHRPAAIVYSASSNVRFPGLESFCRTEM